MNRLLVAHKLQQIATCLLELRPLLKLSYTDFSSTPGHFRLAERDVQLIVDSAVDINNHLLLQAGKSPPATDYDSFIAVGTLRVLPPACARKLAATAGLRNRIVHQYETVDLRVLHQSMPAFVREYSDFARRVRTWAGI